MLRFITSAAALTLTLFATRAQAHITLENKEVVIGTFFKLVLRVPHGCAGSATTKVRVQIPKAFSSAKPQPKPGWSHEIVAGKKDVEHTASAGHDHGVAPKEILWAGRLDDNAYDEFAIWVSTAKTEEPGLVYVPIVQECGDASERWIEIPGAGGKADDLKSPAPALKLLRSQ